MGAKRTMCAKPPGKKPGGVEPHGRNSLQGAAERAGRVAGTGEDTAFPAAQELGLHIWAPGSHREARERAEARSDGALRRGALQGEWEAGRQQKGVGGELMSPKPRAKEGMRTRGRNGDSD